MTQTLPAARVDADGSSVFAGGSPLENRFHVIALVFQRARQLQNGARPRVEPAGHKHLRLALLEVLANTLSWTIGPSPSNR